MEKVAIIDVCNFGSTGKIANNIQNGFKERGYQCQFYYGRGCKSTSPNQTRIKPYMGVYIHAGLSRITGLQGFFSILPTLWLINKLKNGQYDTIILISTHSYFLNEHLFFSYIANHNLRFLNIMPDAYPYLGNCTACEPNCQRYITGKGKCPNIKKYPPSLFFDTCGIHLKNKIKSYSRLKRAKFIAPEYVINDLNRSLVGRYMSSTVIDESIDVSLYQPRDTSKLRQKHKISDDKIVVLCVAPPYKKAQLFIEMAKRLENNSKFFFIYIGKLECEQRPNLLHISFVKEDIDLAYYYSLADVFVFTSVADTMANACLEALACGTPLVVFNISGMPYLMNEEVGKLVAPDSVEGLVEAVLNSKKKDNIIIDKCRFYALSRYDSKRYVDRLIQVANSIE